MSAQLLSRLVPLLLLTGVAACTTPHAGDYKAAAADPWEKTNRKIYAVNKKIDRYALRPAAKVYRTVVPTPARHGIANAFSNYNEPLTFVNAILQGKIKQAFRTLDRFIVNSTIGVAGLADVATDLGRPEEPEDFGQTFAVWGIPSGPYLMLPFFGPSTVRDGVGTGIDLFYNPSDLARNAFFHPSIFIKGGQILVNVVNLRERASEQGADQLLADSLDEYTLVKSAYLQSRRSAIWDGNPPPDDEDMLPDEPQTDAPASAAPAAPPAAAPPAAAPSPAGQTPGVSAPPPRQ